MGEKIHIKILISEKEFERYNPRKPEGSQLQSYAEKVVGFISDAVNAEDSRMWGGIWVEDVDTVAQLQSQLSEQLSKTKELEAELEWWHSLIDKWHKNGVRSNLQEVVQSFIDRAENAEAERDGLKAYKRFYEHIRECVDKKYSVDNHVICAICHSTFETITQVEEQALKDSPIADRESLYTHEEVKQLTAKLEAENKRLKTKLGKFEKENKERKELADKIRSQFGDIESDRQPYM